MNISRDTVVQSRVFVSLQALVSCYCYLALIDIKRQHKVLFIGQGVHLPVKKAVCKISRVVPHSHFVQTSVQIGTQCAPLDTDWAASKTRRLCQLANQ